MSLGSAKVLQTVDDLDRDVVVKYDPFRLVVDHLQDAPYDVGRDDDGRFGVDRREAVQQHIRAVDFVREGVRGVGRGSCRADRRPHRDDVAPVGIREPARCLASSKDVLRHEILLPVCLGEPDQICTQLCYL